jgi:hypothetical protein
MFKHVHLEIPAKQWRSLFGFHWLGACRGCFQDAERLIAFLLLFLGAGLLLAQPCMAGSGVFEDTGSLVTGRYGHTATLLPNGKVLVVAGHDFSPSAELYNPVSGIWTPTGSLTIGRIYHTATLLPNGKVLVAGGIGPGPGQWSQSTELYDPASGNWTTTDSLATGREYHTATLLPNGKVLVAGGYNSGIHVASAEIYDPENGTWAATGSLVIGRDHHTATLLRNGKVLVVGGVELNGTAASAELYDPANGTWTATGNLAARRAKHTATLLPNGQVLVAGGASGGFPNVEPAITELYDPSSETWADTGSLPTGRTFHTATLLPNGRVLVAGPETDAALYEPANGTWTATDTLATRRISDTATLLPNGKVLVAGGHASDPLASAELYVSTPAPPALLNIATRMRVLTDDRVLIGGFIITGTELKRVLIRGVGPSLNGVGVTLSDPTLELHQGDTTLVTNDNWKMRTNGSSQQADIEATTIAPADDLEPAILVTLSPGAYTAILAGKNGGTGVGLVEVYDLGQGANSQLANISTRGFVDTGDNVMIGGLIVGGGAGGGTARVLVRALGPSVPVAGALGDPTLELHDGSGALIASNDNWKMRPDGSSQQEEIEATALQPGNDHDSALVRTLSPGNYTAIVRGTNDNIGVGLVETYNLP